MLLSSDIHICFYYNYAFFVLYPAQQLCFFIFELQNCGSIGSFELIYFRTHEHTTNNHANARKHGFTKQYHIMILRILKYMRLWWIWVMFYKCYY